MYNEKVDRLHNVFLDRAFIGDQAVESYGGTRCDHEFPQEHDNLANSTYYRVTEGVGPDDLESVLGSVTETFAS